MVRGFHLQSHLSISFWAQTQRVYLQIIGQGLKLKLNTVCKVFFTMSIVHLPRLLEGERGVILEASADLQACNIFGGESACMQLPQNSTFAQLCPEHDLKVCSPAHHVDDFDIPDIH